MGEHPSSGPCDDARAVIEKPVLAILRKNKAVIETIAKGVLTEDRVFRLGDPVSARESANMEGRADEGFPQGKRRLAHRGGSPLPRPAGELVAAQEASRAGGCVADR
jgi:hypothetical protein